MKKATIVEDAIDHIKNLQDAVDYLNDQLLDAEASPEEGMEPNKEQVHAEEEIMESRIQVLSSGLINTFSQFDIFHPLIR